MCPLRALTIERSRPSISDQKSESRPWNSQTIFVGCAAPVGRNQSQDLTPWMSLVGPSPVVAVCDLPPPDRTLAIAYPRHVGGRCGMTCDAQKDDGVQVEPDWDMAAQPAPGTRPISSPIGEHIDAVSLMHSGEGPTLLRRATLARLACCKNIATHSGCLHCLALASIGSQGN
jgi:hypothetical protein